MKDFSQEKQIDAQLLRRKRSALKRERIYCFFKEKLKFLIYVPFLLILIYFFFYSPFFLINEIEINELSYTNGGMILEDFEILENENFFLTELSDLREEAIQKHPFIENIYTEKVFPNRVIIHVREKEPHFVASNQEGCFLLDDLGFVLAQGECSDLKANYSVREVSGFDLNNIDFELNSQSNFYNAEKIAEIIRVLNYYGYNVKEVVIENQVAEFTLHDERLFVFSFANDIEKQLKRFIIVKKKIDYDNISFETIDMRYERPVLR